MRIIRNEKPFFLIVSPMCRAFSSLQIMNRENIGEAMFAAILEDARVHLKFAMDLCAMRVKANRYFLHEHPLAATSWGTEEVRQVWGDGRCATHHG